MKPSIVGALLGASLLIAPVAHADTTTVPIGDPYTDTIQLWSSIAWSIEYMAQEATAATQGVASSLQALASSLPRLNNQPTKPSAPATSPQQTASLAAAVASFQSTSNAPATSTEHAPIATSDQTTNSQNIKSAISALTNATTEALTATKLLAVPGSSQAGPTNFVTQPELTAQLQALANSLTAQFTAPEGPALPQWVAADGNPNVPYAGLSNITNLSDVTISNANLTASEIPALDYLSLTGGSLSGNLSVAGNATTTGTSYFTGNIGIGTSTSQDALSINGSEYLPDITAPPVTTNRLYANGGSLYWAGNVIAGGATGNWTSDGTNVWRTSGDIGVGTTSPFATVSIVGTGYFTGALTAAGINAANATTTNATSTNLFSTFGNFTTGLINSLSGTELTYTAASTTNFSNTGTAYFGGTGQTTIDTAGDLNVGGSLTLSNALTVANGGTGWSSFASGYMPFGNGSSALATSTNLFWDNTNGRLGIGTTSPSATLSVNGNSYFTGEVTANGVATNESVTKIGDITPAQMAFYGVTNLSGAPTSIRNSYANYFTVSTDDMDTTGNTNPGEAGVLYINHVVGGSTEKGGRTTLNSNLTINATTGNVAAGINPNYVSAGFYATGEVNDGGTSGANSGQLFGINPNVLLGSSATYWTSLIGGEIDVAAKTGSSLHDKIGLQVVQTTSDGVSGDRVNGGIVIANEAAAGSGTTGWTTGIQFGTYSGYNPIAASGTLIGTYAHAGTGSMGTVANGIDFSNYTFSKDFLRSAGFTVDGFGDASTTEASAFGGAFFGATATSSFNSAGNLSVVANGLSVGNSQLAVSGGNVGIGTSSPYAALTVATPNGSPGSDTELFVIASSTPIATTTLLSIDNTGNVQFTLASSTFSVGANGSFNPALEVLASTTNAATGLAITSNLAGNGVALSTISSAVAENLTIVSKASGSLNLGTSNTPGAFTITSNRDVFSPGGESASAGSQFSFTGASNSALTASIEAPDVQFNLAQTKTHSNGAIVFQRAFLINAPTEAFTTFSATNAITNLATLAVTGAPVTGSNGTTTNAYSIYLGASALNASTTNSYGMSINANTGAKNNYAADFLGGDVGIGTTSPYSPLTVWGSDSASSTAAFTVVNSASTTDFAVFDGGNAELSGSLSQSSDQRLKTNIQSLGASSSLSLIDSLNPVTFNWIDPNKGTTLQLGFIAQQVEQLFPDLVSTTSATALTPDGTLSLNYIGLISPIVSAIQALSSEIASLENTIAGFAESFTTQVLNATQGNFSNELCVGSTCVTPAQFQAMVAAAGESGSTPDASNDAYSNSQATDTPPQIQINGDNPATVQAGDTYNDLGATITGPEQDLNLGITTYVNGIETSPVQIDTSAAATDTIDYVVTDQNGITSTSTRALIIEAPSIVVPTDDASSGSEETATTTNATTTAE